jgi:hypothetical protein
MKPCYLLAASLFLLITLLSLPVQVLCQEATGGKYTPPVNSPFGKDSRSRTYNYSEENFRFLLGVPAISILKGEVAMLGIWTGRDFSAKLKLGAPYKLNRFDFSNFWDDLNLVDEMVDERASLKQEHKLLTKPVKGFCAGLGLRYLATSDISGFTFVEVEYNMLMNRADFNTEYLLSGSDPTFRSTRHDFTFAYGKTFMLGDGEKFRPYIEESIGFGMGYVKATSLLTTNTYERYETNGERFKCLFPLLSIQLNIGIATYRR